MKRICVLSIIAALLIPLLFELANIFWFKHDIARGILVKYGIVVDIISLFLLLIIKLLKSKCLHIVVYVGVMLVQFLYWQPYDLMLFYYFVSSIIVLVLYYIGISKKITCQGLLIWRILWVKWKEVIMAKRPILLIFHFLKIFA